MNPTEIHTCLKFTPCHLPLLCKKYSKNGVRPRTGLIHVSSCDGPSLIALVDEVVYILVTGNG